MQGENKELRKSLDSLSVNYKKLAVMKWALYEISIQIEKCLKALE